MGIIEELFGKSAELVLIEDIKELLERQPEERRALEYKGAQILDKPSNLSQSISAFLNSSGGVILIGVWEDRQTRSPEDAGLKQYRVGFVGAEYTKERVEQLIFDHLHFSTKPDIRIYPIRNPSNPSEALYLIEIPPGDNPPYQAGDFRYYHRSNFRKQPMLHSEIAERFGRKQSPQLAVSCEIIRVVEARQTKEHGKVATIDSPFDLCVYLQNEGKAAAEHAKVIISLEHLKLLKVIKGPSVRIDELRNGVPTLQWGSVGEVVLGRPSGLAICIWELRLKPDAQWVGSVSWEVYAERMEPAKGKYVVLPMPFAQPVLNRGGRCFLPEDSSVFPTQPSE